jgi:hypothetical protein
VAGRLYPLARKWPPVIIGSLPLARRTQRPKTCRCAFHSSILQRHRVRYLKYFFPCLCAKTVLTRAGV